MVRGVKQVAYGIKAAFRLTPGVQRNKPTRDTYMS